MNKTSLIIGACAFLMAACAAPTQMAKDGKSGLEQRTLDTIQVEGPKPNALRTQEEYSLPVYNPSGKRTHDLLHVRLELGFNFEKEEVYGRAVLDLKPYFHPAQSLVLDAKGFEWKYVGLPGRQQALQYDYNGERITIDLGKAFNRNERYQVELEYVARPKAEGGSSAITSDQGLFFINPRGEEQGKPTQIWTQGETSWNSRWFPVIDQPNERCTQEMFLTVPDIYKTLSNGILVSQEKRPNGMRTDYWRMDMPHAPYLFMLAIGDFAVVKDSWRDKEIAYYVEPAYAASARDIFRHTPEMLEFFSNKLGVPFPWQKYSQIIVRDYVSGAMENTTAVVFGEFIQKHSRDLIDDPNDKIVAHEMFHHWFGDLVTCESWANLTMNEGFANYSEYLWFEHKYGRDAADFHLSEEWAGYLASSPEEMHPLIHFGYDNDEAMFDAHSYNKGGAVLHMLRKYVGDEAFFTALNRYLTKYAFSSVEAHHLRLEMEEVSGEDLNWFFNQWYFNQGHPELDIQYGYDENTKEALIRVEQLQNPDRNPPIFDLPVQIDIYAAGKVSRYPARVNERVQTIRLPIAQRPDLINFDAEHMLLAEIKDNRTEDELVFQFRNAPRFLDRYGALNDLLELESPRVKELLPLAAKDTFWVIRAMAIGSLDEKTASGMEDLLKEMAERDAHSEVRASALVRLSELNERLALESAKKLLTQDSSFNVVGVALEVLHQSDPQAGLEYAAKLENEQNESILLAISTIYRENPLAGRLAFFEKNFKRINTFDAILFIGNYQEVAYSLGEPYLSAAVNTLRTMALDEGYSPWHRLGATKALNDLRSIFMEQAEGAKQTNEKTVLDKRVSDLSRMIEEIKTFEKNPELKSIYQQLDITPRK